MYARTSMFRTTGHEGFTLVIINVQHWSLNNFVFGSMNEPYLKSQLAPYFLVPTLSSLR
jgi:hypothetical protein